MPPDPEPDLLYDPGTADSVVCELRAAIMQGFETAREAEAYAMQVTTAMAMAPPPSVERELIESGRCVSAELRHMCGGRTSLLCRAAAQLYYNSIQGGDVSSAPVRAALDGSSLLLGDDWRAPPHLGRELLPCEKAYAELSVEVWGPAAWTILQCDGPNHLGLRYNVLPEH